MAKVVTIQKNYAFYTVEDHFAIVDGKEYQFSCTLLWYPSHN